MLFGVMYSMFLRITTELILKGYLFRKGHMKVSVFKLYLVSECDMGTGHVEVWKAGSIEAIWKWCLLLTAEMLFISLGVYG